MLIDKNELLKAIKEKYGNLDDECGCIIHTENGYAWLSIKDIVDIINDCTEYQD